MTFLNSKSLVCQYLCSSFTSVEALIYIYIYMQKFFTFAYTAMENVVKVGGGLTVGFTSSHRCDINHTAVYEQRD